MRQVIFIILLFCAMLSMQAQRQTVVSGVYGVNSGSYISFPVWMGGNSGNLRGWFRVANKDIECLLLDEQNYNLYNNGYDAFTIYNTGRVSSANLNIRWRGYPQWYYVVFSNKHGWTTKTVESYIEFY